MAPLSRLRFVLTLLGVVVAVSSAPFTNQAHDEPTDLEIKAILEYLHLTNLVDELHALEDIESDGITTKDVDGKEWNEDRPDMLGKETNDVDIAETTDLEANTGENVAGEGGAEPRDQVSMQQSSTDRGNFVALLKAQMARNDDLQKQADSGGDEDLGAPQTQTEGDSTAKTAATEEENLSEELKIVNSEENGEWGQLVEDLEELSNPRGQQSTENDVETNNDAVATAPEADKDSLDLQTDKGKNDILQEEQSPRKLQKGLDSLASSDNAVAQVANKDEQHEELEIAHVDVDGEQIGKATEPEQKQVLAETDALNKASHVEVHEDGDSNKETAIAENGEMVEKVGTEKTSEGLDKGHTIADPFVQRPEGRVDSTDKEVAQITNSGSKSADTKDLKQIVSEVEMSDTVQYAASPAKDSTQNLNQKEESSDEEPKQDLKGSEINKNAASGSKATKKSSTSSDEDSDQEQVHDTKSSLLKDAGNSLDVQSEHALSEHEIVSQLKLFLKKMNEELELGAAEERKAGKSPNNNLDKMPAQMPQSAEGNRLLKSAVTTELKVEEDNTGTTSANKETQSASTAAVQEIQKGDASFPAVNAKPVSQQVAVEDNKQQHEHNMGTTSSNKETQSASTAAVQEIQQGDASFPAVNANSLSHQVSFKDNKQQHASTSDRITDAGDDIKALDTEVEMETKAKIAETEGEVTAGLDVTDKTDQTEGNIQSGAAEASSVSGGKGAGEHLNNANDKFLDDAKPQLEGENNHNAAVKNDEVAVDKTTENTKVSDAVDTINVENPIQSSGSSTDEMSSNEVRNKQHPNAVQVSEDVPKAEKENEGKTPIEGLGLGVVVKNTSATESAEVNSAPLLRGGLDEGKNGAVKTEAKVVEVLPVELKTSNSQNEKVSKEGKEMLGGNLEEKSEAGDKNGSIEEALEKEMSSGESPAKDSSLSKEKLEVQKVEEKSEDSKQGPAEVAEVQEEIEVADAPVAHGEAVTNDHEVDGNQAVAQSKEPTTFDDTGNKEDTTNTGDKADVGPSSEEYEYASCDLQANNLPNAPLAVKNPVTGRIVFKQKKSGGPMEIKGSLYGLATDQPMQHAIDVHEYGDLSNGCQTTGMRYTRIGQTTSTEESDGLNLVQQDETEIVQSAWSGGLVGEHSILGRAVVVHAVRSNSGQSSEENSPILACCIVARSSDVTA